MSIVKAKCLKCNQIIEVEDTEDAGICPNCGSAYVTEKVIKNLNVQTTAQQPKSKTYQALANLAEKYNAFVKLYKIDNYALLNLYKFKADIIEKENQVEKLIDEYNSAVKSEQRMVNRYNRRVDGFNDAKYTAGADSMFEKIHKKYVDSALSRRDSVVSDIKYAKKRIEESNAELDKLCDEGTALAQKTFADNFRYNLSAKSIAEKMCNEFPSNPLGYLYLADWYKREAEWQKKFFEFARERYEADSIVVAEFTKEFSFEDANNSAKAELEKAQTFMSDDFNAEYGDLVERLNGAKKAKKSTAQSSARSTSNAKTPSSTAKKPTAAKSSTSANSKSKSNAKTKPTASTTPKFKSGSEKQRKKKQERKLKARHLAFKLLFNVLGLGILAAIVACVCKFVFHLF